jgi:hypothetical protein
MHIKDQFADSRSHLTPDFRRVHIVVAAVATLIIVVVALPILTWLIDLQSVSVGLVAITVFVFGAMFWSVLVLSNWIICPILTMMLFCLLQPARRALVVFVTGHFEAQAVGLLALGAAMIVTAGMRLFRLNEDMPGYQTGTRWGGYGSRQSRPWSDEGRVFPRLMDWIQERQMARLTRLARQASESRWARICRWQAGMVAGGSLWFWIAGTLVYAHIVRWWAQAKEPEQATVTIGVISFVLTLMPAVATVGILQSRMLKLGRELLLPVQRKSYIRQLGTAAAVSHLQLWAGMSLGFLLSLLLTGPRPIQLAVLAGVLASSAAFQVAAFGLLVWVARYRTPVLLGLVVMALVMAMQSVQMAWTQWSPGQSHLPYHLIWIAAVIAVVGLLITWDAYRRWLVADFD